MRGMKAEEKYHTLAPRLVGGDSPHLYIIPMVLIKEGNDINQ